MAAVDSARTEHCVLVTGANAGLGFSICRRLIDEFLHTRPTSHTLTLIFTTRSQAKAEDTIIRLRHALHESFTKANARNPGASKPLANRIKLNYELLDLLSLRSVQDAAARLRSRYTHIEAVILNAGMGGWTAVDWLGATKQFLREGTAALTWPEYKTSESGRVAAPQLQGPKTGGAGWGEPQLGEVFTANVFGHYVFVHGLVPLLAPRSRGDRGDEEQAVGREAGRIIWISTLEAYADAFEVEDLQCLKTSKAYEASKRLTDLLALTSRLPSTGPWTKGFFSSSAPTTSSTKAQDDSRGGVEQPRMYLAHPGICATSIMPLPLILQWAMLLAFYICRLVGSIWHTCDPYTGAVSAVWLALASAETMQSLEKGKERPSKWGSATDPWGNERVERTEVEGWGVRGGVGEESGEGVRRGRRKGATDVTREGREEFEVLGRECWRGMEELREQWEKRLAAESRG